MNKLQGIYEDTVEQFENISTKKQITTKHKFEDIFTLEDSPTNVVVINSDTVSAGVEYSLSGKTCILNMASYKRPGGGVKRGARAQEECLFRCSNLFEIPESFYPLQQDECLYTKDATFIKNVHYGNMKPVILDVVTVAAVNLNKGGTHNKEFTKTEDYAVGGDAQFLDEFRAAKDALDEEMSLKEWGQKHASLLPNKGEWEKRYGKIDREG